MRETQQPQPPPPPAPRMTTLTHVIPAKAGIHAPASKLQKRQTPPAVDGNRHNATESDEPQRKLVRARARGNRCSVSFLSA